MNNENKFLLFFKKKIEPFMVIGVLILLAIIANQLIQGNELRETISENCGWAGEDYACYCEKTQALFIKDKMNNNLSIDNLIIPEGENVKLDR